MNIQIFGRKKCFDTKKAERYFKERNIKFQKIDLHSKGISRGELLSILKNIDLNDLINDNAPCYHDSLIPYTSDVERKIDLITEFPEVLHTPIVRNGKQATLHYQPDVWKTWK